MDPFVDLRASTTGPSTAKSSGWFSNWLGGTSDGTVASKVKNIDGKPSGRGWFKPNNPTSTAQSTALTIPNPATNSPPMTFGQYLEKHTEENTKKTNDKWTLNPRSYLPEMLGGYEKVNTGPLGWRGWGITPTIFGGISKKEETGGLTGMTNGTSIALTLDPATLSNLGLVPVLSQLLRPTAHGFYDPSDPYTLTRYHRMDPFSTWGTQQAAMNNAFFNQGLNPTSNGGSAITAMQREIDALKDRIIQLTLQSEMSKMHNYHNSSRVGMLESYGLQQDPKYFNYVPSLQEIEYGTTAAGAGIEGSMYPLNTYPSDYNASSGIGSGYPGGTGYPGYTGGTEVSTLPNPTANTRNVSFA